MTSEKGVITKESWFNKHPRKTIIVFLFIVFISLILGAEKYLDSKDKDYLQNQHENRRQRFIRLREHPPLFDGIVKPNDDLMMGTDSLKQIEYKFSTDDDGFIIPSKKHSNPEITIVFLGGSTTECMAVQEQNRFPFVVGKILEEKSGMKINSINSGVSGNNSLHSLNILLNKIIPLNPDIVVMMHNINDLNILLLTKSYWNKTYTKSPIQVISDQEPGFYHLLKLIKNILIPNLYKKVVYGVFGKKADTDEFFNFRGVKVDVDEEKILNEFQKNLQTFVDISRIRGITPVLMTMANRFTDTHNGPADYYFKRIEKDYKISRDYYKKLFAMFNQAIIDVGKRNNISFIDLASEFPQTKDYMYDVVHFNDKGSQLAAEIISGYLLKSMKKNNN